MKLAPQTPFVSKEKPINISVSDFWQWSQSNLLDNNLRGHLAEYIVGMALELEMDCRLEWESFDLETRNGVKIEVKSSAFLQSWNQQGEESQIRFSIAQTYGWKADTSEWTEPKKRHSDIYVFCVFEEQNRDKANPIDLDQWTFYLLPTKVLDDELGNQKNIVLNSLKRLNPVHCSFEQLKNAFDSLFG